MKKQNIIIEKTNEELLNEEYNFQANLLNSGFFTFDDLKKYINSLINSYILTNNSEWKNYVPKLDFFTNDNSNKNTLAFYSYEKFYTTKEGLEYSKLNVSLPYAEQTINKPINIADLNLISLINTIGHELTHWKQHCMSYLYETMDINTQQNIDSNIFKIFKDCNLQNNEELDKKDIKKIENFLAPYLNDEQLPDSYKNDKEKYFNDISFGFYIDSAHEVDARKGGIKFVIDILFAMQKNPNLNNEQKKLLTEQFNTIRNFFNSREKKENYFRYMFKNYENAFTATTEEILKIVQKQEKLFFKNNEDVDIFIYSNALKVLVKNKSLDEKRELLKNAIFHGYSNFGDILINSIINDENYKNEKANIENDIYNYLINSSIDNTTLDYGLNEKSYKLNYKLMISEEMYTKILKKLLEDEKYVFADTFSFQFPNLNKNNYKEISKIIKTKAEKIIKENENKPENYSTFYSEIYNCAAITKNINKHKKDKKLDNLYKTLLDLDSTLENDKYKDIDLSTYSINDENEILKEKFKNKYGNRQIALKLYYENFGFEEFVKEIYNIDINSYIEENDKIKGNAEDIQEKVDEQEKVTDVKKKSNEETLTM